MRLVGTLVEEVLRPFDDPAGLSQLHWLVLSDTGRVAALEEHAQLVDERVGGVLRHMPAEPKDHVLAVRLDE